MTEQRLTPDLQTRTRLLANLRRTRLELEEFGLQLEEVTNFIERDIQQKRLKRIQRSLGREKD